MSGDSKSSKVRHLKVDPKHIKMPSDLSNGFIADLHLTNLTQDNIAFKFRMRDPKKCSVRPPKGVIPPAGLQDVKIHVMPATPEDRVDKLVIDTVPVGDASEVDTVWKVKKNDVAKHAIGFKYDEGKTEPPTEPPSECPSGFVSVAQTPASSSDFAPLVEPVPANLDERLGQSEAVPPAEDFGLSTCNDSTVVAAETTSSNSGDAAAAAELKELKEKYEKLVAERNELQARVTALQGQNAKLQADAQQKKANPVSDENRADRRSWIMFAASLMFLLTVIIYSLFRPSSSSSKSEL